VSIFLCLQAAAEIFYHTHSFLSKAVITWMTQLT